MNHVLGNLAVFFFFLFVEWCDLGIFSFLKGWGGGGVGGLKHRNG